MLENLIRAKEEKLLNDDNNMTRKQKENLKNEIDVIQDQIKILKEGIKNKEGKEMEKGEKTLEREYKQVKAELRRQRLRLFAEVSTSQNQRDREADGDISDGGGPQSEVSRPKVERSSGSGGRGSGEINTIPEGEKGLNSSQQGGSEYGESTPDGGGDGEKKREVVRKRAKSRRALG